MRGCGCNQLYVGGRRSQESVWEDPFLRSRGEKRVQGCLEIKHMASRWAEYGNKITAMLWEITILTTSEDTAQMKREGGREGAHGGDHAAARSQVCP